MIQKLMKVKIKYEIDALRVRPNKSEVDTLCCDNNKIISSSNWIPKYDLKKGLIKTIQWYKKNSSLFQSDSYNV